MLEMKTLSVISYKPKPDLYDEFLDALLEANGYATSFILGMEEKIWEFWINSLIEEVSDEQPSELT